MNDNEVFKVILITKGRRTGKPHSVILRAVRYNNKLYFSRRNSDSDWLKNALANPKVRVEFDGSSYEGIANLVKDEKLAKKISHLKYTDKRAEESRIVLEVSKSS